LSLGAQKETGLTSLCFYCAAAKQDWRAASGEFGILAGSSSVDIKLQGKYSLAFGEENR